jgi:hypothetical protein
MGESAGQQVYNARSKGALWSIACHVAGVRIREGLAAAREYADANDLPWPPEVPPQKTPNEFLGTRELRQLISETFRPRYNTLTSEQERVAYERRKRGDTWTTIAADLGFKEPQLCRHGAERYAKRCGLLPPSRRVPMTRKKRGGRPQKKGGRLWRGLVAYRERLVKGDSWKVIAERLGYNAEYKSGYHAAVAARSFAETEGLPWPVPSKEQLPKEPDAGRAYFIRGTGLPWIAVALIAGYTTTRGATDGARAHAEKHGLPWPV